MDMPTPAAALIARKPQIVERLKSVLSEAHVISDAAETRVYECDALSAYACQPLAVVLPGTTAEVSDILRICHEEGVPVVPRGSGTSTSAAYHCPSN